MIQLLVSLVQQAAIAVLVAYYVWNVLQAIPLLPLLVAVLLSSVLLVPHPAQHVKVHLHYASLVSMVIPS